jgi:hypothetical protein
MTIDGYYDHKPLWIQSRRPKTKKQVKKVVVGIGMKAVASENEKLLFSAVNFQCKCRVEIASAYGRGAKKEPSQGSSK